MRLSVVRKSRSCPVSRGITEVYTLVDWHNVQRFLCEDFHRFPERHLPQVLFAIQECVAKVLQRRDSSRYYRVTTRVYHGWHEGREATPVRRVFDKFEHDEASARRFSRVSFRRGFQYGDSLACDFEGGTLFSTFRSGGQKMVDTAICCDLLHLLSSGIADTCVILSDDDDFVPALATARTWQRNAILIREPASSLTHVVGAVLDNWVEYWERS